MNRSLPCIWVQSKSGILRCITFHLYLVKTFQIKVIRNTHNFGSDVLMIWTRHSNVKMPYLSQYHAVVPVQTCGKTTTRSETDKFGDTLHYISAECR
jgi:hypothetical protein